MSTTRLAGATALLLMGIVAGGLAPVISADSPMVSGPAKYRVTFIPSWNPQTHPIQYPLTHAKKGLLTPMIGATHGRDFSIFKEGTPPSPGLERLSEMGKHDPLDQEIRQAISSGKAGMLIETDMGSPGPVHEPVSLEFEVTPEFPVVSLVGMIAPSPDWFYGVSGVELARNGQWLSRLSVDVYAWDSGGDAGTTYLAEDQDLEPKAATTYSDADNFKNNGERTPVGTFVFKRVPGNHS